MAGYGLMLLLFLLGVTLVVFELFISAWHDLCRESSVAMLGAWDPVHGDGGWLSPLKTMQMLRLGCRGSHWISSPGRHSTWRLALLGSTVLMMLMMRYLPGAPLFNRLVMSKVLVNGDSTGLDSVSGGTGEHVGLQGLATTDLRPAGKGDFNGRILDVTAANGFIAEGKEIIVSSEDGVRILVKEA